MTAIFLVDALPHFADRWATAMLRALWQGGVAILIVWAICLIIPSLPARMKCWLWRLAAVKLIVSLLWLSPLQILLLPSRPATSNDTSSRAHVSEYRATPQATAPLKSFDSQISSAETTPRADRFSPLITLLTLWVVGVIAGFIRILMGLRHVRRLRGGGESVGDSVLNGQLNRLCQAMKISAAPKLAESTAVSAPVLIGVLRPSILLPKGMFPPGSQSSEIALAHELAHIRRGDLVWNWLKSLVGVVFFFNPLVWLLMRESRLACETACDALAVQVTGRDPISYTRILVDVAALQPVRPTTGFAIIGMIETAGTLERRIRSLLRAKRLSRRTLFFAGIIIAVLAVPGLLSWQLVQRVTPDESFAATTIATQPAGTLITGQVLAADSKPVEGATVYLETHEPDGSVKLAGALRAESRAISQ